MTSPKFPYKGVNKLTDEPSYTTEEVAGLLKISKLTVYDLIKKGALPAYRVGRQMRVDAADLAAYKISMRQGASWGPAALGRVEPVTAGEPGRASASASGALADAAPSASANALRQIVITGQDLSLDLLAQHIERGNPGFRPLRSYSGSLASLVAMYQGRADVVSTHLIEGETGEYNVPYIRKLFVGHAYKVINLLSRWAGFYVREGNPLGLTGWGDLDMPGLRLVNREKGSGARVLLDEMLRIRGMSGTAIIGYDFEEASHLGVAGKVSAGEADVGVGVEKAARIVGVEFVPLIKERYDLVLLKKPDNLALIETVEQVLGSAAFKSELQAIPGYDLSLTGEVMFET